MRLDGKYAVITGGNSGIGLATAEEFVKEGAKVVITGRNQETIDQAVTKIGDNVIGLKSDTSNLSDIDTLVNSVSEKTDKIDVLFINAGIAKFAPVEASDETLFDETINVNLKGAYFTIQKFLPLLKENASIILNASAVINVGFPNTSIYTASKAALSSLAKTLSAELQPKNIRVNTINPGAIETPIYGRLGMPEDQLNGFKGGMLEQIPAKRFGESIEIAKAAVFLGSDESKYIVGTELNIDGGLTQV